MVSNMRKQDGGMMCVKSENDPDASRSSDDFVSIDNINDTSLIIRDNVNCI